MFSVNLCILSFFHELRNTLISQHIHFIGFIFANYTFYDGIFY